jgi:cytochrome oxidase assembly protein ShyY1
LKNELSFSASRRPEHSTLAVFADWTHGADRLLQSRLEEEDCGPVVFTQAARQSPGRMVLKNRGRVEVKSGDEARAR